MKKYDYKFFKDGYPDWKKKKDSILVRNVFRPISFCTAAFAANHSISANQVSFLSMIIAIASAVLYLFENYTCHIVGAFFVIFWMVMDCTDGNLARSVKKQSYGDFADGISSYVLINFLFIALGMAAYRTGGLLFEKNSVWIVFIGALAASFDSLARLVYQKFANTENELEKDGKLKATEKSTVDQQKGIRAIYRRFTREVGLNGLFLPTILICTIFNWLDCFVCFYALVFGATFAGTLFFLIRKVLRFNALE